MADVRLDNRRELAAKLGLGVSIANIYDDELLLHAYRRWGEEAPSHLLGDFAYAIWDDEAKSLNCVRDHLGVKPLYYSLSVDHFFFASSIQALLGEPSISKDFCEEAVAIYLGTGALYHRELTFYTAIRKLPPATSLTVTGNDSRFREYWNIEQCPKVVLDAPDKYVSKLRLILEDAVSVRMESDTAVGAHLSGGLDSSAIVAIASKSHNVLQQTYSWVPPANCEQEAESGEWAAAAMMAQLENLKLKHIEFDGQKMLEILQKLDISHGDTVDLWYEYMVREDAGNQGIGVILSGWGGDQFISNHVESRYAATFWRGHLRETLTDFAETSQKSSYPLAKFLRLAFSRLLFRPISKWWKQVNKQTLFDQYDLLSCCHEEFQLKARHVRKSRPINNPFSIRSALLWEYRIGHLLSRIESWAAAGKISGVEYRYPLLDKRVVEFALGIPGKLYRKNDIGRFIFRSAVSDILPKEVCWGNLKMEPARVSAFEKAQLEAVISWNQEFKAHMLANSWIDGYKLKSLIGRLEENKISDPMEKRVAVRTALQSILVLNMGSSNAPLYAVRN